MRKIIFHMAVSLDGYFEGPNGDLSWHNVDEEFNAYAAEWMNSLDVLIFGRNCYNLMYSYWPTAKVSDKNDAVVIERMNNLPKIVFSKTLQKVDWNNSILKHEIVPEEMIKLKQQPGKDITVGGSELAVSFIKHNLIDEFRLIIAPVVLGGDKKLFDGLEDRLNLKLIKTRNFKSGNILHYYEPSKRTTR